MSMFVIMFEYSVQLFLSFQGLKIVFLDFDVEYHSSCMWDYLEIFELEQSGSSNIHSLGKFCGLVILSPIQTSSNRVSIVFHSDYIIPKTGFRLYINTMGKLHQILSI